MKGDKKVIAVLNDLLSDELTAVNEYMVHSEMCDNWGYARLHKAIERRAIDEMKHAEKLIGRILFLEGIPVVSKYGPIRIGETVAKQIDNDLASEVGAIKSYNDGVKLCGDKGDNGTRELLEDILKDEERHLDWLEAQRDQIAQVGIGPWLAEQLRE
jgi:bacterioferritin